MIFIFNFLPNIISIREKLREVAFSALNHLITSEQKLFSPIAVLKSVDY